MGTQFQSKLMTIEEAQAFLQAHPYGTLKALIRDPYYGERNATLCTGRESSSVMVLSPRSRSRGYLFKWDWALKVFAPTEPKNPTEKFKKEAQKDEFYNDFIEKCLMADPAKSPYHNRLTTGTDIDGKCITIKAIEKDFGHIGLMDSFWEAFDRNEVWHSLRYRWRGYDLSLWVNKDSQGSGLNMEYRDCGNGYYYMLINDEKFIGVDID